MLPLAESVENDLNVVAVRMEASENHQRKQMGNIIMERTDFQPRFAFSNFFSALPTENISSGCP